jgi:branched-chain amino acid transport system ATP-binding protein
VSRLRCEGLAKHFGGLRAVDDVGFCVEEGELVALIGPNGAGKTTVFTLLAGEDRADGGTVELDGRRIDRLAVHQRARRGMARTYQRLEVFPDLTVLDHLLVAQAGHRGSTGVIRDLLGHGRPTSDEVGRAMAVLRRLGIESLADTVVARLSLGSCRLVELARALVTSPVVLLADEPSSGLDAAESSAIAELLRELRDEGLAIVLIEHDLELVAAVADRVVVMDLGRVLATGSYDEVMADGAVRAAYLGTAP